MITPRTWLRQLGVAIAVVGIAASSASAQTSMGTGGSGSSGGGSTGGSGGGSTGTSTGGIGSTSGGGIGSTSGGGIGSTSGTAATGTTPFAGGFTSDFLQTTTTNTGGGLGSTGSGFNANSSSNPVAPHFANPLFGGKPSATYTGKQVGGFGAALYTWRAPTSNIAGRITDTSARGASTLRDNMYASATPGRRIPAYSLSARFQVAPPDAAQLRASASAAIANTSVLSSRDNVQVSLDGQTIVLRGRVADTDERALVENMLRLTPGMRNIRNELSVDATVATASR